MKTAMFMKEVLIVVKYRMTSRRLIFNHMGDRNKIVKGIRMPCGRGWALWSPGDDPAAGERRAAGRAGGRPRGH